MNRPGMILNKIDWECTHKKVVRLLSELRKPCHYRDFFHQVRCPIPNEIFSETVDPSEKFRQYYAEHLRPDVVLIPTGYLALRRWFPDKKQLSLLPPDPHPEFIKGNCLLSYDTGYEQALRQQHMFDHYNDAPSTYRYERRRRGALAESHIRNLFWQQYPTYYQEPSNHNDVTRPAKDDFSLVFPGANSRQYKLIIDVKTWSNDDNGIIRNIQDDIVYLWGDWLDDETVRMDGIESGKWLSRFGLSSGQLTYVKGRHLLSMDVLFVILNMALAGMDYNEFRTMLNEKKARVAA